MVTTLIGIAGGTASGKTTLANKVYEATKEFGSVAMIRVDDYYKCLDYLPLEDRKKRNFDHPDAYDMDLLIEHLKQLKKGVAIEKPKYDFSNHTRSKNTELIKPVNVVIVEGIMTFAIQELRDMFDIKIFVDTNDDIRFIRRLKRDIRDRGRTVDDVIEQYLTTVRPMHETFVEPSKRYADIIIPIGGKNEIGVDIIVSKIANLLRN